MNTFDADFWFWQRYDDAIFDQHQREAAKDDHRDAAEAASPADQPEPSRPDGR